MRDKPRLRWPLIWFCFALYLVAWAVVDAFIDREADATEALGFLPFCAVALIFALRHLLHRGEQRQQWRHDRFIRWLKADNLPAPAATDWERFERDVELRLGREDRGAG